MQEKINVYLEAKNKALPLDWLYNEPLYFFGLVLATLICILLYLIALMAIIQSPDKATFKKCIPILALVVISVISPIIVFDADTERKQLLDDQARQGSQLVRDIFNTYIQETEFPVYTPKETLSPNRLTYGEVVKTSFNFGGKHYNDAYIYVTYTEQYPSDTLIPFENPYKELNDVDTLALSIETGTPYTEKVSLKDIDFIYNIEILEDF